MGQIIIGSDHAGFALKEYLKRLLSSMEVEDVGAFSETPSDYPKNAVKVARKVQSSKGKAVGILVCGTGLGEAIVANKFRGIRAANCFSEYTAKMAREHNDANILCLGARILSQAQARKIVDVFLSTSMSTEVRHRRRVGQIRKIDENR